MAQNTEEPVKVEWSIDRFDRDDGKCDLILRMKGFDCIHRCQVVVDAFVQLLAEMKSDVVVQNYLKLGNDKEKMN